MAKRFLDGTQSHLSVPCGFRNLGDSFDNGAVPCVRGPADRLPRRLSDQCHWHSNGHSVDSGWQDADTNEGWKAAHLRERRIPVVPRY